MHNYRNFKDYHIERLRDPEDAKIYFSVACADYKETKDIGAFLLAVGDVAEARGRNFDDFLKEVGIFDEVSDLCASEVVAVDNMSKFFEDLTRPIALFSQWCRQTVRYLFTGPFAFGTAGFGGLVLIIGGVYLGNHLFTSNLIGGREIPANQISKLTPVSPPKVEPTLVRGQGRDVRVSPFGFGAFPKIPADFPDQDIWNVVRKRSVHDPKGAKTLELLVRVRIELWNQGNHTKGVIMHPSSGLVYSDSDIKILFPTRPDLPEYDIYFDEDFIPSEGIVVKFLKGGIDPYEFLNLPR